MTQYIAAGIMLLITMAATLLLLLPVRFRFGSDLVKFYWSGVFYFLAAIAFVAGGAEVLKIVGLSVDRETIAILAGLMTSYILFVAFGWFRLVGVGLLKGFRKITRSA